MDIELSTTDASIRFTGICESLRFSIDFDPDRAEEICRQIILMVRELRYRLTNDGEIPK